MKFHDLGDHKVFQGDSLKILTEEVQNSSVDLVFLDPPYFMGKKYAKFDNEIQELDKYLNWIYDVINECLRALKSNGSLYLMSNTEIMPYLDIYLSKKMHTLSRIVWAYDSSSRQAKNYYGSLYEPILFCVKSKSNYTFNSNSILIEAKTGAQRRLMDYRKNPPEQYSTKKVPGNVWNISRVRYRMPEYAKHPTQKPEKLLERIILASSNERDIILDPFAGSFTSAAVSKKLNRKSISIELQKEYVSAGLTRLENT